MSNACHCKDFLDKLGFIVKSFDIVRRNLIEQGKFKSSKTLINMLDDMVFWSNTLYNPCCCKFGFNLRVISENLKEYTKNYSKLKDEYSEPFARNMALETLKVIEINIKNCLNNDKKQ